jgi:hypothetical protein
MFQKYTSYVATGRTDVAEEMRLYDGGRGTREKEHGGGWSAARWRRNATRLTRGCSQDGSQARFFVWMLSLEWDLTRAQGMGCDARAASRWGLASGCHSASYVA